MLLDPKTGCLKGKNTHHIDGQNVEPLALAPNKVEGDGSAVCR